MKLKSYLAIAAVAVSSFCYAGEITVSAASSLTNAFKEIATIYQQNNPDEKVNFNFDSSGKLLQQMRNGAPVDVFASADQKTMLEAQKSDLIKESNVVNFARNQLVLIQPIDSKNSVNAIADLTAPSIKKIAIGNPENVPAGTYTKEALEKANLWHALKSKMINTQNVRQALEYVAGANVDAGMVYRTDAYIAKDKVIIKGEIQTVQPIIYPIATLASSKNKNSASKFINFVTGDKGQEVLAKYGFIPFAGEENLTTKLIERFGFTPEK